MSTDNDNKTLGNLIDEQQILIDVRDGDYITHLMVLGKLLTEEGETSLAVGMPENLDLLTAYGLLSLAAERVKYMILDGEDVD